MDVCFARSGSGCLRRLGVSDPQTPFYGGVALVVGLALLLSAAAASAQPAQVVRGAVEVEGEAHAWALVLPKGYDPAAAAPLHVSLHGGGRKADERTCLLQWKTPREKPFLLLCPTFPQGRWWTPAGDATLMAALAEVRRRYRIDPDRITLGGMSNGGTGVWHHAIKRPGLWAALAARAAPAISRDELNRNFAHLPILILHARDDRQIKVEHGRAMRDHLTRLGATVRYIEPPTGGHHFLTEHNPEVIDFLLPQTRRPRLSFTWHPVPGAPPAQVEWLEGAFTAPVTAQLTLEGDAATVRVTAADAPEVMTIHLPDALISPDLKTVTLYINDVERYSGPPQHLPPPPDVLGALPGRGVRLGMPPAAGGQRPPAPHPARPQPAFR